MIQQCHKKYFILYLYNLKFLCERYFVMLNNFLCKLFCRKLNKETAHRKINLIVIMWKSNGINFLSFSMYEWNFCLEDSLYIKNCRFLHVLNFNEFFIYQMKNSAILNIKFYYFYYLYVFLCIYFSLKNLSFFSSYQYYPLLWSIYLWLILFII